MHFSFNFREDITFPVQSTFLIEKNNRNLGLRIINEFLQTLINDLKRTTHK